MGAVQNSMLAALGTAAVAGRMIAGSGSGKEADIGDTSGVGGDVSSVNSTQVSQANDGALAAKMADKARQNTLNQIKTIINNKAISGKARSRRINKALKEMQGGNK